MKPLEVLFVEDNCGDTLMVYEAFEASPMPVKFHLARDGEQALLMLRDRTFDPDLWFSTWDSRNSPGSMCWRIASWPASPS